MNYSGTNNLDIDNEILSLNDKNKRNEFTNLNTCNYILPENIDLTGFTIFTLNIRSIKKNFDNLKNLLEEFKT